MRRKIFSLLLVCTLLLSTTTVFAAPIDTEVGDTETDITATKDSTWSVNIPESITVLFDVNEQKYLNDMNIIVKGDIDGAEYILVKPKNDTLTLIEETSNDTAPMHLSITKTKHRYSDLANGVISEATCTFSADKLHAGTWSSNCTFTIALKEYLPGLKQNDGSTILWSKLLEDGLVDVQSGVLVDVMLTENGYSGELSLPDDGSVTAVGGIIPGTASVSSPFYNQTSITKLIIPDEIQTINSLGTNYVYGKTYLMECIELPKTISSDSDFNFAASNINITTIIIPEGANKIAQEAFYCCKNLSSITLPNSIKSIESRAFYGCSSLTSLTIPNSVTSIGGQLIQNSGIKTLTFEEGSQLKSIGGCGNAPYLETVVLANGLEKINDSAFQTNPKLTTITIPDTVTTIGNNAFDRCTSLESIYIPDNVTSMGNNVFYGCTSLKSISISRNTTITADAGTGAYHTFYGIPSDCVITYRD